MAKRRTHEEFIELINDINPNIEIIGKYVNAKTNIDCKCKICGHKWSPRAHHLLEGYGCPNCNHISRRKTHEQFIEEMNKINPNIEILGKYNGNKTKIKCRCKICGHVWKAMPSALLKGCGCNQCAIEKRKSELTFTQEDFNNLIKSINPNIEVIGKYINMHTSILCICKLCNSEFYICPNSLYKSKTMLCPVCSDGVSYPNKYVRNLLKQLPIENLEYEWKPEWGKQYSYDNYFTYNEKEYIVEADGAQHFKDSIFSKLNKHTYEDIKKRDQLKDKLADSHNIIMIRIDCRMSDPNYIKDSVLSSVLSSVFDLSNVDWNYCHVESLNSLVRQACNLYKNGYKNVEILRELKISSPTLIRYLKTGSNLGWCNYINPLKKKILVYDKITMEKKYVFNSSTECSDYLSELFGSPFKRTMITSVCNGYKKSYKGFIFKYES